MRITIPLAVAAAAILAGPAAFAGSSQSTMDHQNMGRHAATNSGAGVHGMAGSKSGPAVTPSGKQHSMRQSNNTPARDTSHVKGLAGNKSGPAVKPPNKQ